MLAHPSELGRGEAGEDDVAGLAAKRRVSVERSGFVVGAGVVPQDTGTDNVPLAVEHGCPVHLPGNADALNRANLCRKRGAQFGEAGLGRFNPVGWILFAPPGVGAVHLIGRFGGSDHTLIGINQQGTETRAAQIQSNKHLKASSRHHPPLMMPHMLR